MLQAFWLSPLVLRETTCNLLARCRDHLGINQAGHKIKAVLLPIWDHVPKSGHDASLENFKIVITTFNAQLSYNPLALFQFGDKDM